MATRVAPPVVASRSSRPRSVVLAVLAAELVVLLVTGVWLYFVYRPTANQAWGDLAVGRSESRSLSDWLRTAHRATAWLSVLTAVVEAILLAAGEVSRRWRARAVGAGLLVSTAAAFYTGYLLPWDQLGLWAVTVGSHIDGFEFLFGDEVRFVLIGGEVSPGTVLWWLWVHALLLGPATAGLTVLAWRFARSGLRHRT